MHNRIVQAYGVVDQYSSIIPMEIQVKSQLRQDEVRVEIHFSGVCHSDIHHAENDWKDSMYPMVPGHEIVGKVIELGSQVTRFKIGEIVGVGNMVDSCEICDNCLKMNEQYCSNDGPTFTYNSHNRYIREERQIYPVGDATMGGYSKEVISRDKFTFKLPQIKDHHILPPFLCAAVAMWWPLKYLNLLQGSSVGILGIGGLGHMGVQMASKMGYNVIALSRNSLKKEDCYKLGASDFVVHTDREDRTRYQGKLDCIISTVPTSYDLNPFFSLLKPNGGIQHILGNFETFSGSGKSSFFYGKHLTGSNIIGTKDTQEMINWCVDNDIKPWVEVINPSDINKAWKSVKEGNARYRYVIDLRQ